MRAFFFGETEREESQKRVVTSEWFAIKYVALQDLALSCYLKNVSNILLFLATTCGVPSSLNNAKV